jgi:hypothetical protein
VKTGLARELVATDPAVSVVETVELTAALEDPEPGDAVLLTETTADVGTPDPRDPVDGPAAREISPELGEPVAGSEGLPPTGAVANTVCTEVWVENEGIPEAPAVADVAAVFPGPELLPPADATTVTKEGEAEPRPVEERKGDAALNEPELSTLEPATVNTVVEPRPTGALEDPATAPLTVPTLVVYEGPTALGLAAEPVGGVDIELVAIGGSAMMVIRDGTGPAIVVTMVSGGGGPDPDKAESGGSAVAITVITDGVGPPMVVTMVTGSRVPGAEGSDTGPLGAVGSGTAALAVTVTTGGRLAGPLEFEGTTGDEDSPGLDGPGAVAKGPVIVVLMPLVEPAGPVVAVPSGDDAESVAVPGGAELGNAELVDTLGREVLETVSVEHSSLVSGVTDLELLETGLLDVADEDSDEEPDGLHTPGEETPNRHLHDVEQGLPGVPFASLPLSHSSPNDASILPSPQPRGMAPRAMMYGIPDEPSAYDSSPSPVAFRAIAKASKPSVPGFSPSLGNSVNTSWTLQDQLLILSSSRLLRSGSSATRWASL